MLDQFLLKYSMVFAVLVVNETQISKVIEQYSFLTSTFCKAVLDILHLSFKLNSCVFEIIVN